MNLDTLLQRADIWRGGEHSLRERAANARQRALPSGYAALDEALPTRGWPVGALTELLLARPGIGELRLLVPALARLTGEGRRVMLIAPPHLPYAPALATAGIMLSQLVLVRAAAPKDGLWVMEQALRSGACGAVLGWTQPGTARQLRRLQLAAETGAALGLLFRPLRATRHASPAALRLQLEPAPAGLRIRILKCRGGWHARPVIIRLQHALHG